MIFHRFKKQIHSVGAPAFAIVGLGNPGAKYELTRHNVGFMFIDRLADRLGVKVKKLKFKALYADAVIAGTRVLLVKPQTFMNNSGEAEREIIKFYKIPPENLIVVFDDISLNAGKLRIRKKGSDGGHNGIKSIIYHTSSDKFPRIKIGIGPKPHPDMDLADFVMGRIKGKEEILIAEAIDHAADAVSLMISGNTDAAMNQFN